MILAAGYLLSYSDARAVTDRLGIPDKGVNDTLIAFPINDWLARTKRRHIVCNVIGNTFPDCQEAKGVLLITHIKAVRQGPSQDVDLLGERAKDEGAKQWLIKEGEVKEDSLRWMPFRDADKLGLLSQGTRPRRSNVKGSWVFYKLTPEQSARWRASGKTLRDWDEEVTARGEVVDRE